RRRWVRALGGLVDREHRRALSGSDGPGPAGVVCHQLEPHDPGSATRSSGWAVPARLGWVVLDVATARRLGDARRVRRAVAGVGGHRRAGGVVPLPVRWSPPNKTLQM